MSRQTAAIDMNVCSTVELPSAGEEFLRKNRHPLFHIWR
jgi:hypothetical protein